MAATADTVAAQLESVKTDLVNLFETSDQISSLIKKSGAGTVENLTRYLYRIVFKQYNGGTQGKYNANGGSLPVGTGMLLSSLQAGYFYGIDMFRVTDEQVDLSKNSKQSVVNVMSNQLQGAMIEMGCFDDQCLHGSGDGFLTMCPSSITGTNTMVFAGASDTIGISRLREGMAVDVWTYQGTTKRAAGTAAPIIISTLDEATKTVVFNQNVTALDAGDGSTTGDRIAFYNLDAYGPTVLTGEPGGVGWPATTTSTGIGWPATSQFTGNGLTNDSWRHGLYYAHDFTSSNYYLGKLKSSYPQLQAQQVAAGGNDITWQMGFSLFDRIDKRRGSGVSASLVGIASMAQRSVVFDKGVSLSTKMVTGDQGGKNYDPTPSNDGFTETFNFCNRKCYVDKRQNTDRIDFIGLKNWGRAQVFDTRPYEKSGRTVFEGRASTGAIASYSEFGFHNAYDFVCYDPGAEGAITGASVPANY